MVKKTAMGERLRMIVQSAFGLTRQEAIVLIILISGGIIGMIIRRTGVMSMQGIRAHDGMSKANLIIDSMILAEELRVQKMLISDSLQDTISSVLDAGIQSSFPKKIAKQPTIIDMNAAGVEDFMQLPGIGPSIAEKIINYRKQQSFDQIEDIMNVKGIGEKKFEKMKPYLKIGKIMSKNR